MNLDLLENVLADSANSDVFNPLTRPLSISTCTNGAARFACQYLSAKTATPRSNDTTSTTPGSFKCGHQRPHLLARPPITGERSTYAHTLLEIWTSVPNRSAVPVDLSEGIHTTLSFFTNQSKIRLQISRGDLLEPVATQQVEPTHRMTIVCQLFCDEWHLAWQCTLLQAHPIYGSCCAKHLSCRSRLLRRTGKNNPAVEVDPPVICKPNPGL